jgi:hypothetical protein
VLVAADPAQGAWQMFPRDSGSVRLIQDGRWKMLPNPVDWVIRRPFHQPIAVRQSRDSGLAAVIMARSEDCFAVSTPQQTDPHRSLYLSLYGRTIKRGETAQAQVRLVITSAADSESVLRLYDQFGRTSAARSAHRRSRGR